MNFYYKCFDTLRFSFYFDFSYFCYGVGVFFQPNSAAAKLLKRRRRTVSDSAEYYHQAGSGAKDKTTDSSSRTAHYGVPQVLAKTPIINASPHSGQRKQPTGNHSNSFQESSKSFKPRGQPQRPSERAGLPRSLSYPLRGNSRRVTRHSDSHRHLQVSHLLFF